jgi:beta-galactosidase
LGDGTLEGTLQCDPPKELGDLPEFGVIFRMDADFDRLRWYGLGPEETYADRQKGAKLGIFETTAQASMAEYLVPQECGNRAGTRRARITDKNGRGLAVWAPQPFNLSLLPYTPHELENAKHPYELPAVHYSVVRLSLVQMGVGGDDSWGAHVHPEFCPHSGRPLTFTFYLKGI